MSYAARVLLIYLHEQREQQYDLWRLKMKKIVIMVLVMITGSMIVNPAVGYSRSFNNNRGYRYVQQPVRHYNNAHNVSRNNAHNVSRYNNNGLLIAGAALGAVVLGAVIAGAMSQPRYAAAQQVVYTTPPSGSIAYAQPSGYVMDAPPGQWVTVQGQWVNGQWVPAHNAWMPVNP
jgi:uncharacterized integral membrane protein